MFYRHEEQKAVKSLPFPMKSKSPVVEFAFKRKYYFG